MANTTITGSPEVSALQPNDRFIIDRGVGTFSAKASAIGVFATSVVDARVSNVSVAVFDLNTRVTTLETSVNAIDTRVSNVSAAIPTSTGDIAEGVNLYFTPERATTAIVSSLNNISTLGINATPTSVIRFAVNSDEVLLSSDSVGDINFKLNRQTTADDGIITWSTSSVDTARFGLTGSQNLTLNISNNNFTTTNKVFDVDPATGFMLDVGAINIGSSLFLASDTFFSVANDGFTESAVISNSNSGSPNLVGYRSRGTNSTPTIVGVDDEIFNFFCRGYDGAGYRDAAGIRFFVDGTPGTNDMPARITFNTSQDGTTNLAERMVIRADGGVVVGSPTGNSRGAGTINAESVFDDNVLLSCYVFDKAIDKTIDMEKWDSKVPDRIAKEQKGPVKKEKRIHEPARRFDAIADKEKILTADGYSSFWKKNKHLPALPDETVFNPEEPMAAGDWVQRLIETVENQAVIIDELNERLKTLEIEMGKK